MRIIWYGHSAFRLELAGKVVLLDPFLTGNPGFSGDPVEASSGATHILLTHGHDDHVGDTLAITERTGAKVVANHEICFRLASRGATSIDPMSTGGTTGQDGFTVTFVRAEHSSTVIEADAFTPFGAPNGIVVKAPGEPTVYAMGDTDMFDDMALIHELHRPDLVLVPIGDRSVTAALAIRRFFEPRAVIPCHFGPFATLAPDTDAFVAAMEGSGIQVITPHVGMGVTLGAG